MNANKILVSEITQDLENKYFVNDIQEVKEGWKCFYKRNGKIYDVKIPHDYEMIRTKAPGLNLFNKYYYTIGKRRESPVGVRMYGDARPYEIDEIAEIDRSGLLTKNSQDLRKSGKIPGWLLIGALAIVLLIGGVCVAKQFSSSGNDTSARYQIDLNNDGIPDIWNDGSPVGNE